MARLLIDRPLTKLEKKIIQKEITEFFRKLETAQLRAYIRNIGKNRSTTNKNKKKEKINKPI